MYAEKSLELGVHPKPAPSWGHAPTSWEEGQLAAVKADHPGCSVRLVRGSGPEQHHAVIGKRVSIDETAGASAAPHSWLTYKVTLDGGFESLVAQSDKEGPWARALAGLPPLL